MTRNTASSARWELDHRAGESWPWSFLASFSAELSAKTVVFRLALRNSGEAPMPGGLGLHPYLVHDPTDVLTFRTEIDWPVTADFLADLPQRLHRTEPSGQPLPEGTVTLYRSGWDGIFSLRHPDEHVVRLQADPVFDHLVVHRPAEAHYVCVEPTTHAPDGFNLAEAGIPGSGRVILDAGQSLEGSIRISLHD
jgi:aldose 1-epimerase